MITNLEAAKEFHGVLMGISKDLNVGLSRVWDRLSDEEKTECRLATGNILGEILDSALNPLHAEHPSLKPEGMSDPDCDCPTD